MPVTLRRETPADTGAIARLVAAAFRDAPHTSHTEHLIVGELRRAGQLTVSLVAVEKAEKAGKKAEEPGRAGGVLAGHVAVSPVEISDGARGWYGLGPIAVLPRLQRRGIGGRLMKAALAELRRRGARGCVLVGDPGYYRRFGFCPQPGLALPGVPAQYFQGVRFQGAWPAGTVRYHPAFEASGPAVPGGAGRGRGRKEMKPQGARPRTGRQRSSRPGRGGITGRKTD